MSTPTGAKKTELKDTFRAEFTGALKTVGLKDTDGKPYWVTFKAPVRVVKGIWYIVKLNRETGQCSIFPIESELGT